PPTPNSAAAYAVQNVWPTIPAVEEIVSSRPDRCLRITGRTARVTFIGPNRSVDQDIKSAELCDGGFDCCLRIRWTGDVEFGCQQVVMDAHRGRDLRSIAPGGDNGVASSPDGLGDVHPQASTGTGDKPHLLSSHGMFLIWIAKCRSARSV